MRCLAIIVLVIVGQQARPDYNGTWVLNGGKSSKAVEQGLSAAGGRMTLTVTDKDLTIVNQVVEQDGKTLVEASPGGWNERTTVCSFASPTENLRPVRPVLCSAKWDGDHLVITSTQKPYPTVNGSSMTHVTTYSVTGGEMKLVGVGPHPDGKQTLTTTLFYDRAKSN